MGKCTEELVVHAGRSSSRSRFFGLRDCTCKENWAAAESWVPNDCQDQTQHIREKATVQIDKALARTSCHVDLSMSSTPPSRLVKPFCCGTASHFARNAANKPPTKKASQTDAPHSRRRPCGLKPNCSKPGTAMSPRPSMLNLRRSHDNWVPGQRLKTGCLPKDCRSPHPPKSRGSISLIGACKQSAGTKPAFFRRVSLTSLYSLRHRHHDVRSENRLAEENPKPADRDLSLFLDLPSCHCQKLYVAPINYLS